MCLFDDKDRLSKRKRHEDENDDYFTQMWKHAAESPQSVFNFKPHYTWNSYPSALPYSINSVTLQTDAVISPTEDAHEQQAEIAANAFISGDIGTAREQFSNPINTAPNYLQSDEQIAFSEIDKQLESTQGQGEPLKPEVRKWLGKITDTDLSGIQVHTGYQADALSKSIHADAFTYGQNIYFRQDHFNYSNPEKIKLLTHEIMHTLQQRGWRKPVIQKQDKEEDKKYTYDIAIPPGTTSKTGFRQYAEMVIFGRVVNLEWNASTELDLIYNNISQHIGHVVRFTVKESQLRAYGVEPGVKNTVNSENTSYSNLQGSEKQNVVEEINRRYYERTGIKPGTQIQTNDTNSTAIWNAIRDEVISEKEKIDALLPEMKAFLNIENGISPADYSKYAEVAMLLGQMDAADFMTYKASVSSSTSDLDLLKKSLTEFLGRKEVRKNAAVERENLKTRLYGLEDLYKLHIYYKSIAGNVNEFFGNDSLPEDQQKLKDRLLAHEKDTEEKLITGLQENGFNSIADFEAAIKSFEKAFEEETLRIADEHLQRYEHVLYEEEKRLDNSDYVNKLFASLSQTGAKAHFEEANELSSSANAITRDQGGYARGDQELKAELRNKADVERYKGESLIESLDSELVKEAQFDQEAFSRCETAEEMKQFLLSYVRQKKASIDETSEDIHAHPDHIYELDVLFNFSLQAQQIQPGSIHDLILKDKAKIINTFKVLKTICLVIIALALTIGTLGAATPYVLAAGVLSTGLSLYFVYEALDDYNRQNAANDTGLLSNDPSLAWVMLAIAGAAVDLAALHSAFKAARSIAEATKEFNATLNTTLLEEKLAKITALDARIQQNIVKRARLHEQQEKLLSSMVQARGALMVTIPGLAQTGELMLRAIFAIRKGAVSVDIFIAELKAAKLIADTGLTADELLLVKDTFTRARTLANDERLVAEMEKAAGEGDWVKLKELENTKTVITGSPLVHEVEMAKTLGDYLGGGEFLFINSKEGIEGFLKQGDILIPISLKRQTTENIKNIFRVARDNEIHVRRVAQIDSRVILGDSANTVLFIEITNFDSAKVLQHIANSSPNILPSASTYSKMLMKTNDGIIFEVKLK
jgi:hypothetical protein